MSSHSSKSPTAKEACDGTISNMLMMNVERVDGSSSDHYAFDARLQHHAPFLRTGDAGDGAPININGCGSFPLLSRTIYCLTSATANALLFASRTADHLDGRKAHTKNEEKDVVETQEKREWLNK
ncbi:hypothetical protein OUZ56_009279 [Daphnia magna]|uniref:Uncharacterized protein n=1 Tax=Daphnia magna TaxID=35525 RepID=A0ABR0AFI5_9CRUS|nr:hypothetical protein OUZ56_009279 [Daphnia magna]